MAKITIYLDDETEKKVNDAATAEHVPKSVWIAKVIQEKVSDEWPQSIRDMAGSWSDFPDPEELRR